MITYWLEDHDLTRIRFGISPLNELCLSLRAVRFPNSYPLARRWLRTTRAARRRMDPTVIAALINEDCLTPDFLNPRPGSALTELADELRQVVALDLDIVHRDLDLVWPTGWPEVLDDDPRVQIASALAVYWERCFVPHWGPLRAVLRADIATRARVMAEHGIAAMVTGLSAQIAVDGSRIVVDNPLATSWERGTTGTGLVLVPSLFTLGVSHPVGPDPDPMLIYPLPAAGVLRMYDERPGSSLHGLLGKVKVEVLAVADEPMTGGDLAKRMGVTPSAANQHLKAMRDAGLLDSTREGRYVLYRRSTLGQQLLDGDRG